MKPQLGEITKITIGPVQKLVILRPFWHVSGEVRLQVDGDLGQVVDVGPVDVNVGYGFEMGYVMEYDTVGIYI